MSAPPVSRQERWLVSGTLIALAAGVLFVVGVVGAVLGIQYGVVPGPALNLQLGFVNIVAVTNEYPDCNPSAAGCVAASTPRGALPRYYIVWVVTPHKVAGTGSTQEQYGGARLLTIQAGP
jgi:hypothetical protein